ncbi:MAG TPA: hypothetical protein VHZ51_05325, partial [Ktedonobacteraceae bacterium]|nr:hypothetical protein [Ktedonobacteraceae bacterium]
HKGMVMLSGKHYHSFMDPDVLALHTPEKPTGCAGYFPPLFICRDLHSIDLYSKMRYINSSSGFVCKVDLGKYIEEIA